jgi:hypothetical protein
MIMVDELFDRQYRDGRRELNGFLTRVFRSIGNTLAVLNWIEYSAPWADRPHRARTR